MSLKQTIQEILSAKVLNPTMDNERLEAHWLAIKDRLPTPVFWLLGKAQSGKTAIIQALTGDSRAIIGDGIRPCTRTAFSYDFPDSDQCLLRFLDTRGLGEVDYDPSEDIAVFEQQAHLLIVVVKAMDHAQQSVLQVLKVVTRKHPDWPIIVVQTTLHEGYAEPADPHVLPYPYPDLNPPVPADLARSLAKQRDLFQHLKPRFVAVDFTLPEDGFEPPDYGIEALWQAIEEALPLGLAAMIHQSKELRDNLQDMYSQAAHAPIVAIPLPRALRVRFQSLLSTSRW
ncbi:MAG: GTPase domain-containing protein [Candidatus Competibacteraceae bacterium]|nr:GTPase domain-containing protein [Candidatus Competibacteraceae bacterium]